MHRPPPMITPSRLIWTRAPETAIERGTSATEPNIITLGPAPVTPVGGIFTQGYDVAPYPNVLTPVVRKGYIVFGGQIFTVKQTSW